jgi:hypothetical protein
MASHDALPIGLTSSATDRSRRDEVRHTAGIRHELDLRHFNREAAVAYATRPLVVLFDRLDGAVSTPRHRRRGRSR